MTENNGTEGRQERRKRELREKIIKVAVELFEKQGFYNTTMEQIAEAADVARKTLYNYFPVKEAIADVYLRDISMGLARENLESLQKLPDTKSRLLAALKHTYGWVENNPELTGVVLGYRMKVSCETPVDQQVKTGTQSVLENILTQGQQTGEIRSDVSVRLLVMYIDLLRGSMTWDWVNDPSRFELHQEMEKVVDLLLYGVCSQKR